MKKFHNRTPIRRPKTRIYRDCAEYDARPLHAVMNRAGDVDPETRATFKGFANVIGILIVFWVLVGLAIWGSQ